MATLFFLDFYLQIGQKERQKLTIGFNLGEKRIKFSILAAEL